jgi:hypothetical protein
MNDPNDASRAWHLGGARSQPAAAEPQAES